MLLLSLQQYSVCQLGLGGMNNSLLLLLHVDVEKILKIIWTDKISKDDMLFYGRVDESAQVPLVDDGSYV